jgi:predicted nucleic acid-binding protein
MICSAMLLKTLTNINGRANVLVTSDRDLLDLNPFRGVAIVTPADYLARET